MNVRMLLLVVGITFAANAQNLIIKPIESLNLEKEKILFEKFSHFFCGIDSTNTIFNQLVDDTFEIEEKDYLDQAPTIVFFHALFDHQVVGYISCDLMPNYHVHIRKLVIDPEFFTIGLVKELLFAIFENYPKTRKITVSCLAGCHEIVQFFRDFGFAKMEAPLRSFLEVCINFELKVSPKCKICELLYPNMWDNEQDDELENQESEEADVDTQYF